MLNLQTSRKIHVILIALVVITLSFLVIYFFNFILVNKVYVNDIRYGTIKYPIKTIYFYNTTFKGEVNIEYIQISFNYAERNGSIISVFMKIVDKNNVVIEEKKFYIDLSTRDVFDERGRYLGKTIFFIKPYSVSDISFYVNWSIFKDNLFNSTDYLITKIEDINYQTSQGIQSSKAVYIQYREFYFDGVEYVGYETTELLYYDVDTGVLLSFPNPLLSPILASYGIYIVRWDLSRDIIFSMDLGPPSISLYYQNVAPYIILALIISLSIYIYVRRVK